MESTVSSLNESAPRQGSWRGAGGRLGSLEVGSSLLSGNSVLIAQNDLQVRNAAHREAVLTTAREVDMSSLRQDMIEDMAVRGFASNTQVAYLRAVAQLARFYGRSPDRLSELEIQRYLVHLNQEKGLSHSTCNQVVAALRFFYHVTLRRRSTSFVIPAARTPSKLPQVLSREELTRLLTQPLWPKHRAGIDKPGGMHLTATLARDFKSSGS